jgi:integrase
MAWLYKRGDSNFWWIGYRTAGKQVLRSTETTDRGEAEKQLAQVEALFSAHRAGLLDELYANLSSKPAVKVALKAALAEWLTETRAAASPSTVEKYESVATGLGEFCNATDRKPLLADVNTELVRAYLTHRRKTLSASSTNLDRRILAVFFAREVRNGRMASNPTLPIKAFKAARGETQGRRAFTLDELRMLHDKAPDDFWRYMLTAGFYLGQRMGDLICLRWGNVDFGENAVHLTAAKTGRTMHIPMAVPLRALLLRLRGQAGKAVKPVEHLWPDRAALYEAHGSGSFSNEFYTLMLMPCGLVPNRDGHKATKQGRDVKRQVNSLSFHCLRHSFVSMLKITGAGQSVAKELAGHSSDLISDVYTHLPVEVLAKAVNGLPTL